MPPLDRIPEALERATHHQPRARAALAAAISAGPSHAYLFRGPRGSGKRTAARAFAAEVLASGAPDPESARRRGLAVPSPHPDLVWIRPAGAWHLIDELRSEVIRAASMRPFEGEHRVFVIEAAEAMREESQNALLKTLEEPAPFVHLLLLCSEPEALAQTIVSRCQPVVFAPLPPDAVVNGLAGEAKGAELDAVSRLCNGDVELARRLLTAEGRELRAAAESAARAARATDPAGEQSSPWRRLLELAEEDGARARAEAEDHLLELAGAGSGKHVRLNREAVEQVKRIERRARTESLDLALGLACAWFRDLLTVCEGAPELVQNRDRTEPLRVDAEGVDPAGARRALELVLDTRQRLNLNVSEELALEALWYRLGDCFGQPVLY